MIISREKRLNHWFYGTYSILAISGLITLSWASHNTFNQWLALIHSMVAVLFTVMFFLITIIHFKRALGQRKPGLILSGILFTTVTGYLVYSGFIISWWGQTESDPAYLNLHAITAIGSLVLLMVHIIGHIHHNKGQRDIGLSSRMNKSEDGMFPSIPSQIRTTIVLSCIATLVIPALLTLVYTQTYQQSVQNSSSLTLSGSQTCADCHYQIALEWRGSAHRHAASNPVYLTNLTAPSTDDNTDESRDCEGCHSPVLQPDNSSARQLTHTDQETTAAYLEGVSCLSCHTARLPDSNNPTHHLFTPYQPYLFANSDHLVAKAIHNYLLRIMPEQHMQDMGQDTLQDYAICAPCHESRSDDIANNQEGLKIQNEYSSWLDSPFAKNRDGRGKHLENNRCQDCHMPLLVGSDPSADANGMYRSHRFLGANTLIPALYGDRAQFLRTRSFLQTNKIRITIEEPHRQDATQSDKYVDEYLRANTETPAYYYLNEQASIQVIVTNAGVGHDFPGGAKEISEVWLEINITDATGQEVFQNGGLLEDLQVDPQAYFYGLAPHNLKDSGLAEQELIHQSTGKSIKVIPPGKSDVVSYKFDIPSWTKGPITITVVLKYRELRQNYAKWVLKENYRQPPIIDVGRDTILVPIREQPPIRLN